MINRPVASLHDLPVGVSAKESNSLSNSSSTILSASGGCAGNASFVILNVLPDCVCKDFNFDYDVKFSGTYHCEQGYGALINEMYKDLPVEFNTNVKEIDWSGKGVKIVTGKGTISAKKCIITVSNAILSSEKIKFTPKLNPEKQEAFSKISLGHYNRVALEFKKLFSKKAHDSYLYYKVKTDSMGSPKGVGITINPSKSKLCFCDFGGKFGLEISKEGSEAAIDFALNELINIYGSKIKKDLGWEAKNSIDDVIKNLIGKRLF